MIAEKIKENLGCDILEIQLKIPYSSDYQIVVDETMDNLKTRKIPEIEDINVNFDEYDKVILGTAVWWYTIPPPIRTFLAKYNLSGKMVIPFATNAGWLGTFDEIKELCKGKVMNEMSIKFDEDHSKNKIVTKISEIEEWINSLK